MQVYKIRHKESGLYSTGGSYRPGWSKTGKTWNNRGALSRHLSQYQPKDKESVYGDAEIIVLKVVETVESNIPVLDWKNLRSTDRAKLLERKRHEEWKIEHGYGRIKTLKKEIAKIEEDLKELEK